MPKWAALVTTMTLETQLCKSDALKCDIIRRRAKKRQPVMTNVAQISKRFMNQKCHQTCVQCLFK